MSNQRSKTQVMVSIWMDRTLKQTLQERLRKKRFLLSQFIRDAIAEKMKRDLGVIVPDEVVLPRGAAIKINAKGNTGTMAIGGDALARGAKKSKSGS
ncbi:hypothetical protein OH491_13640 [Termitidicoccus mucosus]|uniref:Uncharacterized protein n=1 Tax=Termitidicoccus mucosus TaxID=1184151 RepID=A0A178IH44_9BACT|nr:hypothetical protein AW736_13810 [Opitutaceae bacterium TSB47]